MMRRILLLFAAAALAAYPQKYDGPKPPKPDLPYLKHASELVATEAGQAKEEKQKKEDTLYIVDGAASSARTPLASPIFLMIADKIVPDRLGLYRLEVKGGHREILFGPKKSPKPIRIEVSR